MEFCRILRDDWESVAQLRCDDKRRISSRRSGGRAVDDLGSGRVFELAGAEEGALGGERSRFQSADLIISIFAARKRAILYD